MALTFSTLLEPTYKESSLQDLCFQHCQSNGCRKGGIGCEVVGRAGVGMRWGGMEEGSVRPQDEVYTHVRL